MHRIRHHLPELQTQDAKFAQGMTLQPGESVMLPIPNARAGDRIVVSYSYRFTRFGLLHAQKTLVVPWDIHLPVDRN